MNLEREIAHDLLSIGAVFLRPDEPFTWASGIKSPIYCDNRLTLTAPAVRTAVEKGLVELIRTHYPDAEVLMGTSTAGIAHAAIVGHLMDLPMGYVRSGNKDHGRQNRIEGRLEKGQKVVVVEDLISTAGSCIEVVEALREAGAVGTSQALQGGPHHLRGPGGVEVHHIHIQSGEDRHGPLHGVGDVVELQVQEDLVAPGLDVPDHLGALGIEQLHADLHKGLLPGGELVQEGEGLLTGGEVQGDDDVFCAHIQTVLSVNFSVTAFSRAPRRSGPRYAPRPAFRTRPAGLR